MESRVETRETEVLNHSIKSIQFRLLQSYRNRNKEIYQRHIMQTIIVQTTIKIFKHHSGFSANYKIYGY